MVSRGFIARQAVFSGAAFALAAILLALGVVSVYTAQILVTAALMVSIVRWGFFDATQVRRAHRALAADEPSARAGRDAFVVATVRTGSDTGECRIDLAALRYPFPSRLSKGRWSIPTPLDDIVTGEWFDAAACFEASSTFEAIQRVNRRIPPTRIRLVGGYRLFNAAGEPGAVLLVFRPTTSAAEGAERTTASD